MSLSFGQDEYWPVKFPPWCVDYFPRNYSKFPATLGGVRQTQTSSQHLSTPIVGFVRNVLVYTRNVCSVEISMG